MHDRFAVCIACYVVLPKVYKLIKARFSSPAVFGRCKFPSVVYSFLVIPMRSMEEAQPLLDFLENATILEILKRKAI